MAKRDYAREYARRIARAEARGQYGSARYGHAKRAAEAIARGTSRTYGPKLPPKKRRKESLAAPEGMPKREWGMVRNILAKRSLNYSPTKIGKQRLAYEQMMAVLERLGPDNTKIWIAHILSGETISASEFLNKIGIGIIYLEGPDWQIWGYH